MSHLSLFTAQAGGETAPITEEPLPRYLSVRQVADYLALNEKKVYALAAEGKLPGTKVTGKWLFPRELVDQWILETSHGGLLTDRLVLAGSDDPLLSRAVTLLGSEIRGNALVSYSSTGTRLGLGLLARHRAEVCAIHWGPIEQSGHRHPGLIRQYPQHHQWVIVRAYAREQGLMLSPRVRCQQQPQNLLEDPALRWVQRQPGAGSQRFLEEACAEFGLQPAQLHDAPLAHTERDAAARLAMGDADIAPGVRGAATEFGLEFVPLGWEAFDLVLNRKIYFRNLFQQLLEQLGSDSSRQLAQRLGGYDLTELGRLVWSD